MATRSSPSTAMATRSSVYAFHGETDKGQTHHAFALAIEHMGSTAVPGLPSKPIIDLLVGATSLEEAPERRRLVSLSKTGLKREDIASTSSRPLVQCAASALSPKACAGAVSVTRRIKRPSLFASPS